VGCSVVNMDGGIIEPDGPDEQPAPNSCSIPGTGADDLEARAAARSARVAADDETLAGDSYLADALARLQAAITDLANTRWAARGPAVLTAALRALAREQSQLDAATLRLIADVDARDDVVPGAKPKSAGAALLRTALGVERRKAAREAEVARLITGDRPDLNAMGRVYAAGDISRSHLDVAVNVHRRLGATCRESAMSLVDPDTGETTERRTVEAVDATMAARARDFTVTELGRIGARLVETLNPPTPDGASSRRYLNLSPLPDGSLLGRLCLDPVQSLAFLAVITALAAPRPGKAVDGDGIERDLPDDRSPGQRRADALMDALRHRSCAGHLPQEFLKRTEESQGGADVNITTESDDRYADAEDVADSDIAHCAGEEEPSREGKWEIRRPPGVRTSPYPDVQIIVTATLEQMAHARVLNDRGTPGHEGFARAQQGGGVHPTTLALLACTGRLRRVLLDEHGAVLHLGRAQRLASPAQKDALFARDVGCVVPGCDIAGHLCEIHHVVPWADGGSTDIDNLALVCPRHHVEVTEGTWEVELVDGVPWARPPRSAYPDRPLLRNATHRSPRAA
jgi:hypothetical protein